TDAEYKRSRCGRKTKLSDELKQKILNHLRLSWSPGMIAHEFKLATKSIYNWLNQGRIGFSLNDLPEHGVRQRRNVDQRSKYNQSLGRSIEQRPMMINQRNRIGDFELDTVVGPRGHSKAVLLTLIDRKSRFLWAYRLKDRTTATVNEALTKFLTTFNGPVHSFTVDRGTEFSGLVSLDHNMVLRPITAMLILQLNVVVMNALIGIYVIFILKGLVLSTLVLKI